ncbi:hypothetical protein IW262DRAFT_1302703 [Armillaria fumosa]|nr:hypothetical protein IW262DRAFT_1302703 [Armillaria fumosa]
MLSVSSLIDKFGPDTRVDSTPKCAFRKHTQATRNDSIATPKQQPESSSSPPMRCEQQGWLCCNTLLLNSAAGAVVVTTETKGKRSVPVVHPGVNRERTDRVQTHGGGVVKWMSTATSVGDFTAFIEGIGDASLLMWPGNRPAANWTHTLPIRGQCDFSEFSFIGGYVNQVNVIIPLLPTRRQADSSRLQLCLWDGKCRSCKFTRVGMQDALVNEIDGLSGMEQVFRTALPECVYLQAHMHNFLLDELARLPAICTFHNKAIVEPVSMDDGRLLEIGGDKPNTYLFDIGDWVTPQIGVYEGDIRCIIGQYTWGYDVVVIPQFLKDSTMHHHDTTVPVGDYSELLRLSPKAIASEKDSIQDGFQLLELTDKILIHMENIDLNDLEKFMWPPSLLDWPDDATPIQDIMENSLWKCPMPKQWYFCEGDAILAQLMTPGTVKSIQCTAMEIETEGLGRHWYAWLEVIKIFHLGDYVEVFAGEHKGRSGYVQGLHDPVLIDVLEGAASKGVGQIEVHCNSVVIVTQPQIGNTLAGSPEGISQRMWTGKVPWLGLHVIVLPAKNSKKQPLDSMATTLHVHVDQVNDHKGKIGTILDVNIDQTLDSGLRVYIWLDYDEVIEETTGLPLRFYQPLGHNQQAFLPSLPYRRARKEEHNVLQGQAFAAIIGQRLQWESPPPPRPTTPPHEGSSTDHGTGNAWDVAALELPDPRTLHWSRDPQLAQPGVTPLEPTVHDFHCWVIIKGHHVVQQITLGQDEHDSLVGKAFEVANCDLCEAADSQKTLDINFHDQDETKIHSSWRQSPSSLMIKKIIVEYIPKTTYGKVWEHRKPAPKDNSDLSSWVEAKGAELEKMFPDFYKSLDPKKLDDARKKFAAKCRNAKNDEKERLHKWFFDAYFALPFIPTLNSSH